MKNIYFIEAKSPGAHIFSRTRIPRLGAIMMATILRDRGYNTKVFIEDIAKIDWSLLEDADMICISSITSTAPRAYEIAKRFSGKKIPVVMGGPHSTFMTEESLQHANYVVRGEGEETIIELVNLLSGNANINQHVGIIKGLSYWHNGRIYHNPNRELIPDLNIYPIPDLNLVYRWNKTVIPVATSRGCPFNCKFCSVIPMFGRKIRTRSTGLVIEELKQVEKYKPRHVFIIDDNFAPKKERARVKELLKAMIENSIKLEWSAQVRADAAEDEELLVLMKKAGCFAVYIGFESINPETLRLYNKGQSLDDIRNAIHVFKKYSINIHGMFVLGSDTDDIQTIKNTARLAKELEIDSVQFMMLTPLPGTPLFGELKDQGRLLHTDWSKYDAHHAVFDPCNMSALELHIYTLKAMKKFYSWWEILRKLVKIKWYHVMVKWYGNRSVSKALRKKKKYLSLLSDIIDGSVKKFPREKVKGIAVVTEGHEADNYGRNFFKIFLEDIGIEDPQIEMVQEGSLPIRGFSLNQLCRKIGNSLGAKDKKIRRAFEIARGVLNGVDLECTKAKFIM